MTKIFVISGIVVFGSMWLLLQYFFKRPDFLSRPEEDQRRTKKQFYWGFYGGIAMSGVVLLLLESKSTGWLVPALLVFYLLFWILGGYMLWLAYRIAIRKDTSKVKKSNGTPFRNPRQFMRSIARINLLCGLALWALAIAIPYFRISFANWAPLIAVIGAARQWIYLKHEKADNTAQSQSDA